MKVVFLIAAFIELAAAGGGATPGKLLQEVCAENKYIKAITSQHGEQPEKCHVVDDVKVTASSLIEPEIFGNAEGVMTGKGVLTDRNKEDPDDPAKGIPSIMVDLSESSSVCGIILGGRTDYGNDHAKKFKVEASADGEHWFSALTEEGEQEFIGVEDGTQTVVNYFMMPIIGKQIKVSASYIMPGAAAAFRVAVLVNCTYKNTFDLGDTCGEDMNQAKFKAIPDCEKIRLICRAGVCEMPRMSWGDDPFTYDSPCCYNAQLEFSSLGDGNFVAWKIPKQRKFGMLFRHGLTSVSFFSKTDYQAYTFDYTKYAKACGKEKKAP